MTENKHMIPDYLEPYFSRPTQIQHYKDYAKHSKMARDIDDIFVCLKGFSSSTPFFRSSTFEDTSLGGGFYFRWHGIGIVVDPGIGFLTQMHDQQIFIDDIDIVIVTHAHIDHNYDVRGIASLQYDYNKGLKKSIEFYSSFFEEINMTEHKITWIVDKKTRELLSEDVPDAYIKNLEDICDNFMLESLSDDIRLQVFRTNHIKDDSYGIKLYFRNINDTYIWGYTSDTKYFDQLHEYLIDCNTLILNISDVYQKDVEGVKFKHGHLGFNGCFSLLKQLSPRLVLISEFTCSNGDFRFEIVKALRDGISNENMIILPAEVAMSIKLSGEAVKCSYCGYYKPTNLIRTIKPLNDFEKIHYVCEKCLL